MACGWPPSLTLPCLTSGTCREIPLPCTNTLISFDCLDHYEALQSLPASERHPRALTPFPTLQASPWALVGGCPLVAMSYLHTVVLVTWKNELMCVPVPDSFLHKWGKFGAMSPPLRQ